MAVFRNLYCARRRGLQSPIGCDFHYCLLGNGFVCVANFFLSSQLQHGRLEELWAVDSSRHIVNRDHVHKPSFELAVQAAIQQTPKDRPIHPHHHSSPPPPSHDSYASTSQDPSSYNPKCPSPAPAHAAHSSPPAAHTTTSCPTYRPDKAQGMTESGAGLKRSLTPHDTISSEACRSRLSQTILVTSYLR